MEPFALFLALGTSIAQAEAAAAEGRLSLEALTNCVYYRLSELMPDSLPLLRDLMFNRMKIVPWLHREQLRMLAGLKTGVLTHRDGAALAGLR